MPFNPTRPGEFGDAAEALARNAQAIDSVREQYRHVKHILALGLDMALAGLRAYARETDPSMA